MSATITLTSLEESLKAKGAIRAGIPITHKELLDNKEYKPLDGQEELSGVLFFRLTGLEHNYLRYLRYRYEIREDYLRAGDWGEVYYNNVKDLDYDSYEAFIDNVEEVYSVKIKDVSQLQELTGITHLLSSGGVGAKDEDEAKEYAIKELSDTIGGWRYSKYSRALDIVLENRGGYKDLLEVDPGEYEMNNEEDIKKAQLTAIGSFYDMQEGIGITATLRDIADNLKAPLSVVVEANKYWNRY